MGHHPQPAWQIFTAKGSRKYLSLSEHHRFLAYASRCPLPRRAFLNVLAYSGCRISEVLSLTIHHLEVAECALIIRTLKRRGEHFRVVPVPEWIIDQLLILFANTGEEVFWHRHRTSAYRWVKRAMRLSGIEGAQACPKGLRHSFGARGALCGLPITAVQQLLGHASIKTTAIYYTLPGDELRGMVQRMWDR